jgi:hypothetical protein
VASVTGRAYDLQFTTNLLETNWWPVAGATNIPGTGGLVILGNPQGTDTPLFYRVTVEKP